MNRSLRPRAATARRIIRALATMIAAAGLHACGGAASTPRGPASPDAAAFVRALYDDHFAHEQNWAETYRRQRALFAPGLAALLDADLAAAEANRDEVVGLDFDPLTDAQETMTRFEAAPAAPGGDATVVGVALFLDTARTNVRVEVERANGAFRVANIRYEHGDLVSLLRRLAEDRRRSR